ncbi:hypothetical protein KTC96_06430 [Clostridium estertheticum]|uniref:hypothetical protein n=1 Tax=Clostridium estertheticum TaxID=238834 RepID=UPI001C7D8269|nr:hypothetical protein [Clostridium estertheticum]MBX4262355.1 hypothetical protein [Clostridium estertheticum]WLC71635.1 hypothetical protein KTC96_06430 [Clostridium estertheticum]
MNRLESCEQLLAVADGFGNYVYNKFMDNQMIFCHPIVETVFLPKGFIPKESAFSSQVSNVQVSNVFLTSKDCEDWGFNYNDMVDTVMQGEDFYIADLRLKVYMSIESYMLEDIIKVLNRKVNGLVTLYNFKWKNGGLGELKYFTIDEFFKGK